MKNIVLFILILGCSCKSLIINSHKKKQVDFEIISLNGIVKYHYKNGAYIYDYENDYYINGSVYIDSVYTYSFLYDFPYSLSRYCDVGSFYNITEEYEYNEKTIMDYEEYFSQNIINPQRGIYYGGDIYYTNDEMDIAVAFRLKGTGIIFNKVCNDYLEYENSAYEDCEYVPEPIKTPFVTILNIDTIYSLTKAEQKEYQLRQSNLDKFPVHFCE